MIVSDDSNLYVRCVCVDDSAEVHRGFRPSSFYSHLRYLTDAPYNMTVYSADFAIVARGDAVPSLPLPLGSFPNSTTGLASIQTASTSQLPSPSSASDPESSTSASVVISPFTPNVVGNTSQPSGRRKNSAGGRVDTERLKFRLVFILWPAMLGVALAL